MATKKKSFGSHVPKGINPMELEINDQTFLVRGAMSGVQLLQLIKAMDGNGDSDSADTMLNFIERSIIEDDRERAMEYLANSEPPVPLTTLTDIITWLIEEYTGKPTELSGTSSDGSLTTGSGNTELPSTTESISKSSPEDSSSLTRPPLLSAT